MALLIEYRSLAKRHNISGSGSPRLLHIAVEAKKIALNQQCHVLRQISGVIPSLSETGRVEAV
jgi:hypothetical protein